MRRWEFRAVIGIDAPTKSVANKRALDLAVLLDLEAAEWERGPAYISLDESEPVEVEIEDEI